MTIWTSSISTTVNWKSNIHLCSAPHSSVQSASSWVKYLGLFVWQDVQFSSWATCSRWLSATQSWAGRTQWSCISLWAGRCCPKSETSWHCYGLLDKTVQSWKSATLCRVECSFSMGLLVAAPLHYRHSLVQFSHSLEHEATCMLALCSKEWGAFCHVYTVYRIALMLL